MCMCVCVCVHAHQDLSLRKQAYSNMLKILSPKIENSQIKILIFFFFFFFFFFFHISAQNIDCGKAAQTSTHNL